MRSTLLAPRLTQLNFCTAVDYMPQPAPIKTFLAVAGAAIKIRQTKPNDSDILHYLLFVYILSLFLAPANLRLAVERTWASRR